MVPVDDVVSERPGYVGPRSRRRSLAASPTHRGSHSPGSRRSSVHGGGSFRVVSPCSLVDTISIPDSFTSQQEPSCNELQFGYPPATLSLELRAIFLPLSTHFAAACLHRVTSLLTALASLLPLDSKRVAALPPPLKPSERKPAARPRSWKKKSQVPSPVLVSSPA